MIVGQFWTWSKVYVRDTDGYPPISRVDCCTYFYKDLWFELGKSIWRKHRSIFQDHVKYMHNDVVNPFRVGILHYSEHILDMHYLTNVLPPPSKKGD